ncbi:hypothetical protein JOQ06_015379 [Pogonophryne albipinna]|uniref:Deoxyribonuclease n=1 Tax=Pogonophryne albipinna TaxID=1090488 RepID=A0AAD6AD71_9TELE|nr:hypothetical protein JOQ06_015379 [Pogonophryne albipinna]
MDLGLHFKKHIKGITKSSPRSKIVLRYDIILIQEVLDPDWKVTKRLMDLVNNGSPQFANISSEPLGPGSHRRDTSSSTGFRRFFYGPSHSLRWRHLFERPPFVVKFSSTETDVEEFVLIPIHTSPRTAAEAARQYKMSTVGELKALVNVVKEAKSQWHNNNIMVLGDFNAAGTYVRRDDFRNIPLFTDNNFHWLIDHDVDTTMSGSQKAYDRIVVTTDMNNGVVPCSADVFNFKNKYGLTQAQTLAVSDDFPVEVELRNTGTTTQTPTTQTPRRKQTYQESLLSLEFSV